MFDYKMRALNRDADPYYLSDWGKAAKLCIRAPTQKDAINIAIEAIGDPGPHRKWVFITDHIASSAIANGTQGDDVQKIAGLLREARATLEAWKDKVPAVSLCADIDKALTPNA